MIEKKSTEKIQFAIVSTDIVLLRNNNGVVEYATKIVQRPPHYDGVPGLIGGVLLPEEVSLVAAQRILGEKTTIKNTPIHFFPLGFYDAVDRDKRGRVVSLAHIGILSSYEGDYNLEWHPLFKKVVLAYDHNLMIKDTIEYIRTHLFISVVALHLMPFTFIISDLKNLFDYIKGEEIDKRNFYKFLESYPIEETKDIKKSGRGRPAQVYKKKVYKQFFLKA